MASVTDRRAPIGHAMMRHAPNVREILGPQVKAEAMRNGSTSLQLPTYHAVKAKAGTANVQPARAIGQGSTTATGLPTNKVNAPRARSAARIGNLCRSNAPMLENRITQR